MSTSNTMKIILLYSEFLLGGVYEFMYMVLLGCIVVHYIHDTVFICIDWLFD